MTVVDKQSPTITCPENIVLPLKPNECAAEVTYADPVVGDNCSAGWVKTEGPNSGDLFPAGVTGLTFTATDASGNATSCSFTVTLTSDKKDDDGDGIADKCDNCPQDPNADQADFDGDGVGDLCDVCQGFDDTIDANGNGVPDCLEDGSDPCATGIVVVDTDGDGIDDSCDICPTVYNPDQLDTDDDGIGDACDNCPAISNDKQQDKDNDGIGDECDNCKKNYNPDQADSNGNGIGDACEKGKGKEGKNSIISSGIDPAEQLSAFPNPFLATLSIRFYLPEAGPVWLQVFNLEGQVVDQVYQGQLDAGEHLMDWNGSGRNGATLPSGMYLLQLKTEGAVVNQRIVLQR